MPEPDVDAEILALACQAAGFEGEWVAWNAGETDWSTFDAAVIRGTWDYPEAPEAFRNWLQQTAKATRLMNPLEAMLPNLHKGYLLDLAAQGVPVVPTELIAQPEEAEAARQKLGGGKVVIKPAIGAGSMGVQVWQGEPGLAFEYDVDHLVQPFMESVHQGGERALVCIDGEFTHKVVKQPRFAEDDESVSEAQALTDEERAFGERVIAAAAPGLLYARVDVMAGPGGETLLSELELIEPSLFLIQNPPAAHRLAAGILRRLA
jgi:glutathione synthase/RimK-type ligase-like ATP-grasp enzyme